MKIEEIKKHLRVIDNFEDDVIQTFLEWSESKVKGSVTNETEKYNSFFVDNTNYQRAVILLTAHYFNNRLPLSDRPQYNLTFGLRDALSHLQADFLVYTQNEEEKEEAQ